MSSSECHLPQPDETFSPPLGRICPSASCQMTTKPRHGVISAAATTRAENRPKVHGLDVESLKASNQFWRTWRNTAGCRFCIDRRNVRMIKRRPANADAAQSQYPLGPIFLFTVTAICADDGRSPNGVRPWVAEWSKATVLVIHGINRVGGSNPFPVVRTSSFLFQVASIGENLRTARRHRSCLQQRKSAPNSCFTIGRKARTQPSQNIRPKNRQLVNSPLSYAPSGWRAKQERTSLNLSRSQRPSKRI